MNFRSQPGTFGVILALTSASFLLSAPFERCRAHAAIFGDPCASNQIIVGAFSAIRALPSASTALSFPLDDFRARAERFRRDSGSDDGEPEEAVRAIYWRLN